MSTSPKPQTQQTADHDPGDERTNCPQQTAAEHPCEPSSHITQLKHVMQGAEDNEPEDGRGERRPQGDRERGNGTGGEAGDMRRRDRPGQRYRHRVLPFLALTLAVEVPLYTVALTVGWRLPWPRCVLAAIAVNSVTHPLLWLWLTADPARLAAAEPTLHPIAFAAAGATVHPGAFVAAEVIVCLVEWVLLMALLRRRDWLLLVLSIAVNAVSVLAGITFSNVA